MLSQLEYQQQNAENIKDPRWFTKWAGISLKTETISRGVD